MAMINQMFEISFFVKKNFSKIQRFWVNPRLNVFHFVLQNFRSLLRM